MLLPVIIIIDYLWLGIMASFMKISCRVDVNIVSALIVYILIIFGIILFIFPHKLASKPFSIGALFCLNVYGIYDFTNLAVIKNWTFPV